MDVKIDYDYIHREEEKTKNIERIDAMIKQIKEKEKKVDGLPR